MGQKLVLRTALKQLHSRFPQLTALAAFLCTPCGAGVADYSTNYPACPSNLCPANSLVWSAGEFDQIYRVKNTANEHLQPQKLSIEELARALQDLKRSENGEKHPLFDRDSAQTFAKGLAIALGQAHPEQDALFLMMTSSGLLGNPLGNSGRAFIDSNGLNLIFGEVGVDFVGPYHGAGKVRVFAFGSHTEASQTRVSNGIGPQPRPDWIVIPLGALAGAAPPPSPSPTLSPELRLQKLKQLRHENLITGQEYKTKKAEILKEL